MAIYGIPRFGSLWTESGDVALYAVDAEDDLIDCEDAVFGDFAFQRFAIVYLDEGDAIWIILCD